MVALVDRYCSIININFEEMKTILIIHNEKEVLSFETFESKEDAQNELIKAIKAANSDVSYKLISETEFIKLIKR
jgi:hypothetical protein